MPLMQPYKVDFILLFFGLDQDRVSQRHREIIGKLTTAVARFSVDMTFSSVTNRRRVQQAGVKMRP